ncbi:hypothetical protein U1Q18_015052 [Sarracenia purpurea var. burkii]
MEGMETNDGGLAYLNLLEITGLKQMGLRVGQFDMVVGMVVLRLDTLNSSDSKYWQATRRREREALRRRDDAALRRRVGVGVVRLVFPQYLLVLKSKDLFQLFNNFDWESAIADCSVRSSQNHSFATV